MTIDKTTSPRRRGRPNAALGEESLRSDGRWWRYEPTHPNAQKNGWMTRNRFVMSQQLGRPLLPTERVGHIDGDYSNDDPANLCIRARGASETQRRTTGPRRRGNLKLSDDDVRALHARYAAGVRSMARLAQPYGVHPKTVEKIIKGRHRADVV